MINKKENLKKIELLAPAGNFSKLKTALYFGADAVYAGGKDFSLRNLSDNFTDEELCEAVSYCHERGKKIYITLNVFPREREIDGIVKYLKFLNGIGADGLIVSDISTISLARKFARKIPLHISTQANSLNSVAVQEYKKLGASRIIFARELSLAEIKQITAKTDMQYEAFAHGAMCISYSGRCLLSNFLSGRNANSGECVQACRWEFELREKGKNADFLPIECDARGTYILNSKDLNMLKYIDKMTESGITSVKIEGRMKTDYYIATVVNAYRRAVDAYYAGEKFAHFEKELYKCAHRNFTTAFYLGENNDTVDFQKGGTGSEYEYIAKVLDFDHKNFIATVEMRNRFYLTDEPEILSPHENFNKLLSIKKIVNSKGEEINDCKIVQERVKLFVDKKLYPNDLLRKKALFSK